MVLGCASAGGTRDVDARVVAEGQFSDSHEAALAVAADAASRERLARVAGRPLAGDVLVAIFMGERPTGGYSVRVDGASVAGSEVRLRGAFVAPGAGAIVTQVITSPFAVVSLARSDLPSGAVTFLFSDSARTLARADAVLP